MAELKSVKFWEPLPSSVEGNPEPNSDNEKCVETRRRVCIKCGNILSSKKRKDAKYCSKKCSNVVNSMKYKLKYNLIKNPGVGTGNNQGFRQTHATWKNGIGVFRQIAFDYYSAICMKCGSVKNICVHHIDSDRTNNDLSNLQVLCKKCHQKIHTTRDITTGRYIKV